MTHIPLHTAMEMFDENLGDIRVALLDNIEAIMVENSPFEDWDIDKTPVSVDVIRKAVNFFSVQQKTVPLLNIVKRIDSYRYYKLNPHAPNFLTDEDIQRAKSVESEWFIQEAELSTRRPFVGLCFAHNDSNASLTLMRSKAKGTLYLKCFACGWFGDSIKYIMDRDHLDFINAVKKIIF